MFDNQIMYCLFCKKLPIYKIYSRISSTIFDILQEKFLQSHPLLMSQKFETQGCQWHGVKQIKYIFTDEGNSRTRIGATLYYLT